MSDSYKYKPVLLKISGEALMGDQAYGIDPKTVSRVAGEVAEAHGKGLQIALVIGAGNIFRGLSAAGSGIERSTADYMGMLATVMNALAMQSALEQLGVDTRVQSAIPMTTVCEPYIRRRAVRHMEKGTQVDGVYDSDPKTNANAIRYETLNYHKVLTDDLKVMDAAAITLMRENNIPIIVFSLHDKGGFDKVMAGQGVCTIIAS
jgi:uridylate kinase